MSGEGLGNGENKKRKRERALNFTPREVSHLFNITATYKKILENKGTNAISIAEKMEAWDKIATEYIATSVDLNNRSV